METTLQRYLDGEKWALKDVIRQHLKNSKLFKLTYGNTLDEEREVTFERAKYLFQLPEIKKNILELFEREAGSALTSYAIAEIVSTTDTSVCVKMGVMGWLFAGAVLMLGTEDQHDKWYKPLLQDLEFTGMFAMSERGHGSNVRGIRTQARYNKYTREFIIHTPDDDAAKMYIGNALQGNFAAVFAQLYINDECKGPHVFIVPVRDSSGLLYPGIKVLDLGLKEGCNGVDNGMIWFDHVTIPLENMLNKYASVDCDTGRYHTSIQDNSLRFNTMISSLLGARMALCFQAIGTMKVGLEITIRYSLRRRQFGPGSDQPETLIMDYQTHQLRLMPYLATSVALTFVSRYCASLLDAEISSGQEMVDNRPLQALAAGLKAYTTWQAVHALQTCRECTGGMGYLTENRLCGLKADADVFVTFEGDNMVMLQQVTKELLAQYSKQFEGRPTIAAIRMAFENGKAFLKTTPISISFESVLTLNFILNALKFKEEQLLRLLAARLLYKISQQKEAPFTAWNTCLHHVTTLGLCHIQRVTLEQFIVNVESCQDQTQLNIMFHLCRLYGVNLMYSDRAWYLENNYISSYQASELRDELMRLCSICRNHALDVVRAFGIPECCVHAPMAGVESSTAPYLYCPDPLAPDYEDGRKVSSKL